MAIPDQPAVAVAVIVESTRVLIIRRRVPERGLVWSFPAGKIEPGETAKEAAVREALEETGVTADVSHIIGSRVHPDTGAHLTYVACTAWGLTNAHVAAPDEVVEVCWVALEQLEFLMGDSLFMPVRLYLWHALGQ